MSHINDVIREFAEELQKIYDNSTAGDHTFLGILHSFTAKLHPIMTGSDKFYPGDIVKAFDGPPWQYGPDHLWYSYASYNPLSTEELFSIVYGTGLRLIWRS